MPWGKAARHNAARTEILAASWDLARAKGLAGFSLRDVATALGIKAPSLYSYFDSKNSIYDAMFAEGNRELLLRLRKLPTSGGAGASLRAGARAFLTFCTEDPVRHQLLFERTLPGFTPSAASYAIAQEIGELVRVSFLRIGIASPAAIDLWTALLSGLAAQQLANEPGGDRWTGLADMAVEMFTGLTLKEEP